MGKENDVMLSYLEDNERFADVFNYGYFGGMQIVKPEELEDASERYGTRHGSRGGKESSQGRTRDIKKRLRSGKELKILALESQSSINYIMPWRCMDYDCREYGKQIVEIQRTNRRADQRGTETVYADAGERLSEFTRTDRIKPVYTLCVYHGVEPWDGPRSLKDMMDFGVSENSESQKGGMAEKETVTPNDSVWERYFADYPMRLLCVNELEDYSEFQSSLSELFGLLPYRNNKKKLREILQENPKYQNVDPETAEAISVLMGVEAFMEKRESYKNQEGYNMCQALKEMMEDSRMEGRAEGHAEGHAAGHLLGVQEGMQVLIRDNLDEGVGCERIVEKLQKFFGLSQEAAQEALEAEMTAYEGR